MKKKPGEYRKLIPRKPSTGLDARLRALRKRLKPPTLSGVGVKPLWKR